ncbi:MAG: hypothetical protein HQ567_06335 [Candidatus Nealsonbacteria bacterium]|nr:hypothetical protein [Candidatus Nealsonbacteria bacterium]
MRWTPTWLASGVVHLVHGFRFIRAVNGKREVSTGIYRLKADTLTWCFNLPGKPIPKTLATKKGDGLTLCVLKRVDKESGR